MTWALTLHRHPCSVACPSPAPLRPVLLPLLYTCTLLPFVVCFVEEEIEPWITLDWIVTTAFALDMCVSFVSAYRNKHKKLVTNGRDIALHYLRGWFWIDLVATFPFGGVWCMACLNCGWCWCGGAGRCQLHAAHHPSRSLTHALPRTLRCTASQS